MSKTKKFEEYIQEAEESLSCLEADHSSLDEALSAFSRGTVALKEASRILEEAQGRIYQVVPPTDPVPGKTKRPKK